MDDKTKEGRSLTPHDENEINLADFLCLNWGTDVEEQIMERNDVIEIDSSEDESASRISSTQPLKRVAPSSNLKPSKIKPADAETILKQMSKEFSVSSSSTALEKPPTDTTPLSKKGKQSKKSIVKSGKKSKSLASTSPRQIQPATSSNEGQKYPSKIIRPLKPSTSTESSVQFKQPSALTTVSTGSVVTSSNTIIAVTTPFLSDPRIILAAPRPALSQTHIRWVAPGGTLLPVRFPLQSAPTNFIMPQILTYGRFCPFVITTPNTQTNIIVPISPSASTQSSTVSNEEVAAFAPKLQANVTVPTCEGSNMPLDLSLRQPVAGPSVDVHNAPVNLSNVGSLRIPVIQRLTNVQSPVNQEHPNLQIAPSTSRNLQIMGEVSESINFPNVHSVQPSSSRSSSADYVPFKKSFARTSYAGDISEREASENIIVERLGPRNFEFCEKEENDSDGSTEPASETPASSSSQDSPVENIPVENIPVENIPVENIPIENIPVENILETRGTNPNVPSSSYSEVQANAEPQPSCSTHDHGYQSTAAANASDESCSSTGSSRSQSRRQKFDRSPDSRHGSSRTHASSGRSHSTPRKHKKPTPLNRMFKTRNRRSRSSTHIQVKTESLDADSTSQSDDSLGERTINVEEIRKYIMDMETTYLLDECVLHFCDLRYDLSLRRTQHQFRNLPQMPTHSTGANLQPSGQRQNTVQPAVQTNSTGQRSGAVDRNEHLETAVHGNNNMEQVSTELDNSNTPRTQDNSGVQNPPILETIPISSPSTSKLDHSNAPSTQDSSVVENPPIVETVPVSSPSKSELDHSNISPTQDSSVVENPPIAETVPVSSPSKSELDDSNTSPTQESSVVENPPIVETIPVSSLSKSELDHSNTPPTQDSSDVENPPIVETVPVSSPSKSELDDSNTPPTQDSSVVENPPIAEAILVSSPSKSELDDSNTPPTQDSSVVENPPIAEAVPVSSPSKSELDDSNTPPTQDSSVVENPPIAETVPVSSPSKSELDDSNTSPTQDSSVVEIIPVSSPSTSQLPKQEDEDISNTQIDNVPVAEGSVKITKKRCRSSSSSRSESLSLSPQKRSPLQVDYERRSKFLTGLSSPSHKRTGDNRRQSLTTPQKRLRSSSSKRSQSTPRKRSNNSSDQGPHRRFLNLENQPQGELVDHSVSAVDDCVTPIECIDTPSQYSTEEVLINEDTPLQDNMTGWITDFFCALESAQPNVISFSQGDNEAIASTSETVHLPSTSRTQENQPISQTQRTSESVPNLQIRRQTEVVQYPDSSESSAADTTIRVFSSQSSGNVIEHEPNVPGTEEVDSTRRDDNLISPMLSPLSQDSYENQEVVSTTSQQTQNLSVTPIFGYSITNNQLSVVGEVVSEIELSGSTSASGISRDGSSITIDDEDSSSSEDKTLEFSLVKDKYNVKSTRRRSPK